MLRVGRNIAETHVVNSTTPPSWFREMFVQVDLPLIVKDKIRLPDGTLVTDNDETDSDASGVLLDPTRMEEVQHAASDSEGSFDEAQYDMEMAVSKNTSKGKNKRKKFIGKGDGGAGHEFNGIAWWAAPSLNLMVFDRDLRLSLGRQRSFICALHTTHSPGRDGSRTTR